MTDNSSTSPRRPDRSQAQLRTERELTEALRRTNPAVVFVVRVARMEDNLCPGVVAGQFEGDLSGGAGRELRGKFRAPFSSSALAVNCFARFKDQESNLRVGGWGGFSSLKFEGQFPTGLGGTPPHLDVVLSGSKGMLAIESKCMEHLGTRVPFFADSYERLLGSGKQSRVWLDEMMAIRRGQRRYAHLDAAQLLKHAFGLANGSADGPVTLLYLYWEPSNASDIQELATHRQELDAFQRHVANGFPSFSAMSYRDLWAQWAELDSPVWLREHVVNLRDRYDVAI